MFISKRVVAVFGLAVIVAQSLSFLSFCWDDESWFANCRACLPSQSGSNVLVTGASSGIGKEIALRYARSGANLIITARREKLLLETEQECIKAGASHVEVMALDLTSAKDIDSLLLKLHEQFGYSGLDYLFLVHANIQYRLFTEHYSLEDINKGIGRTMKTNFESSVKLVHISLPLLEKSKGRIIAVGSSGVYFGQAFLSGYLSSKSALETFLETLRVELDLTGRSKISTTWINLGIVTTEQINATKIGNLAYRPDPLDLFAISPRWSASLIACAAERRLSKAHIPWFIYWFSLMGIGFAPARHYFAYWGFVWPREAFLKRVFNQSL